MDSVTVGAVLLAIVGGAGGAVGEQLWAGVKALVLRPAGIGDSHRKIEAERSCIEELAALELDPSGEATAIALAKALLERAAVDDDFGSELKAWWDRTTAFRCGEGNVVNVIGGGAQHGPVLQGRDFSNLTFEAPRVAPKVDRVAEDPDSDIG